jgi:MFS family permease
MSPADKPALGAWVVWRLGIAQLINWGTSFYVLGAFGEAMARDLGLSGQQVFAGLSVAMVVMGLVSPLSGGLIERYGGRRVLRAGTLINAFSCAALACAPLSLAGFYALWALLGVGMRLSLYDALFAAMAGLDGERARPAMVRITLLGGLASAVFWPLGHELQERLGWQGGLWVYVGFMLVSVSLVGALPNRQHAVAIELHAQVEQGDIAAPWSRQWLYGLGVTLTGVLFAGLAAQLPALLAGMGVPVGLVALWGIGQTCARLAQSLFGRETPALLLNLWVGIGLPLCFALGLAAQGRTALACLFVFGYGALNGLATLLRASLPFELFHHRQYARLQGRLVAPGFILAAFAPWGFAAVRDHSGDRAVLGLALSIGVVSLLTALLLRHIVPIQGFGHSQPQQQKGGGSNSRQGQEGGAVAGGFDHPARKPVAQRSAQPEHR